MKRVIITQDCWVPGKAEGSMDPVFTESVLDLDDAVAGALVYGGKARYAPEGTDLKSTAKKRMAEIDARNAEAQKSPQELLAEMMAKALATATAAAAKPAA